LRFSAQIPPPWASTRPRAIASPSPAPRDERDWSPRQNRSNIRSRASASIPEPRVLDGDARECAGIDPRELEEIVHEDGEDAHLLAQDGHVLLGRGEVVLYRLEHRLHARERCSEVVARPRDELATCVEEAAEVVAHLVEGEGELGDLGRALLRYRNIIDAVPGRADYTPLWAVRMVTWDDAADVRVLRSAVAVARARRDGDVTIRPMPIVVNCPVL
jgi:hypothetical protein